MSFVIFEHASTSAPTPVNGDRVLYISGLSDKASRLFFANDCFVDVKGTPADVAHRLTSFR